MGESWIGARRKLGFTEIPERAFGNGKNALVMPVGDVEGRWHAQATPSEQISVWLCEIPGKFPFDPMGIAFHSLKTTLLSMCVKFGMETEAIRIMGYHAVRKAGSAFAYARDNLAHPPRPMLKGSPPRRSSPMAPLSPTRKSWPQ